ncbi:MAG: Aminopeptidase N [Candidatus Omnitrophica bacterium]|nr:Aminopeptidase N [Candidatus Omnitrophota bacterium]
MPKTATNPYRLERTVTPVHYAIDLTVDIANFAFKGRQSVRIKAASAFGSITLHALDLRIQRAELSTASGPLKASRIAFDKDKETVTLVFPRTVRPSEARELALEYTGELNDKMHGFYRTRYTVDGATRWGAATQFEATDARRCFPCWDEPDLKATFDITLRVPKQLTALSNMPVKSQRVSGELKAVSYRTTPVMPTYLVCFVVADLVYVAGRDKNGVPIRIYTTPGKEKQARFALEVGKHALTYFADWFGIPYSLPKMDMVALPDFASGAMENWGLVTYRETALLVDPDNSSVQARQRVAEVIDHELAHQWFGNLVTMEWWTDLWLNEGFASYMGPKAVHDQFPEWDIWGQFIATEYLGALRDDALRNTHPIEIDVKNPHEIREIFDGITYSKGASVNRMLEHYLSEPVLRKGLNVYLKKYAYGNARTVDLWSVLEQVSGKPVRRLMAAYTRQEGFPVVEVAETEGSRGRGLDLRQSRFIFDGGSDARGLSWSVPVAVRTERQGEVATLLDATTGTIAFKTAPGWIKVNPGQSGFYRVRYAEELLGPLSEALRSGRLEAIDMLGVLDDAAALCRAGRLPVTLLLDLVGSCARQLDYNVWLTLAGILGEIESLIEGQGLAEHRLANFARTLFGPASARMGWSASPSDDHLSLMLRPLLLSRMGHYADAGTVAEARERFAGHLKGRPIDPTLRTTVYGIVSETGGQAEHERLVELYRASDLQEEKVRILRALTRTREVSAVRASLKLALSADVRKQDTFIVLSGFGVNPRGRAIAWEFIRSRWAELSRRFGGGNVGLLSRIIEGAVSSFVDPSEISAAEAFLRQHPVRGTERSVKQAIETARSTSRWARRDGDTVYAWLGAYATADERSVSRRTQTAGA